MWFINPMWNSETERLGKRRCTPLGYALHVIADLLGAAGLLLLFAAFVILPASWLWGRWRTWLLGLLAIPFAMAFFSNLLWHLSWWLARQKGWSYDPATMEARWTERDGSHTFKAPGGG